MSEKDPGFSKKQAPATVTAAEMIARSIDAMTPPLRANPHMVTGPLSSIVDSPLFKVLYNNPDNQRHFHSTKAMIPHALVTSNKDLIKMVWELEKGFKTDWDELQRIVKKFETTREVCDKAPAGLFDWFRKLFALHNDYVKATCRVMNFKLWCYMLGEYYLPTGDLKLKSMFPLNTPDEMLEYLQQSAEKTSQEARQQRLTEANTMLRDVRAKELAYMQMALTDHGYQRFKQLQGLREVGASAVLTHDRDRSERIKKLEELEILRKKKREDSRVANMNRFNHQLGRQGMIPMEPVIQNLLASDSNRYVDQYVSDGTTDAMMQTMHAAYPDSFEQLFVVDPSSAESNQNV